MIDGDDKGFRLSSGSLANQVVCSWCLSIPHARYLCSVFYNMVSFHLLLWTAFISAPLLYSADHVVRAEESSTLSLATDYRLAQI